MLKDKKYKQLGSYGLIINDDKILLIKKNGGPYDGKLDLPGGTIEFGESPQETLKRELQEEVGIIVKEYKLFDANSVFFNWQYEDLIINVHHIGIFYNVLKYDGKIKSKVDITSENDDSLGADFYQINSLKKKELSEIAIIELEKLGYNIYN
ncbi:MAG: NUDIX domain-containing protein [Bacilli bacterium]|nr:NUDIX domain-containing protein [Bacilli bacterium]